MAKRLLLVLTLLLAIAPLPGQNVGVNTSNPLSRFHVNEPNSSLSQTDFTQAVSKCGIVISTSYAANAFTPGIFWSTENNNPAKPKGGIYLHETASGTHMYFGTSSNYATGITNNALVIDPSGNVGVGTVSPSPYKLYAAGSARVNSLNINGAYTFPTTTPTANQILKHDGSNLTWQADNSVPSTRTLTINGTTNRVTVTGGTQDLSGNRTWTITTPQDIHSSAIPTFAGGIYYAAAIEGALSSFITLRNNITGNTGSDGLAVGVDINGVAHVVNKENTDLRFSTNDLERMTVNHDGNIGIGTDAPVQRLDVVGIIKGRGEYLYGAGSTGASDGNGSTWRLGRWPASAANTWLYLSQAGSTAYHDLAVGNMYVASNLTTVGNFALTGSMTSGTVPVARISGTLPVANGGTGTTSLTGYVYGNGTGAFTANTSIPGTAISGNISGNAANVTGTVAVANGGTGATTAAGAQANLGIRKASVVITITPNAWNLITHNLNISQSSWYAFASNGDQAANNFNIVRSPNWSNANDCWVYIEGGSSGNGRINLVVIE